MRAISPKPLNPWQYPSFRGEVPWAFMNEKQLCHVSSEPAENLKTTTVKSRKCLKIDLKDVCRRQWKRRNFGGEKGKNEGLIKVKSEIPERFVGGWDERNRMDSAWRSRFHGVSIVKFFDKAARCDMRRRFSGNVWIGITFLFDQIFELVFDVTGVKNVINFEVFLIIFDVGGRWSSGKSVRRNWSMFNWI